MNFVQTSHASWLNWGKPASQLIDNWCDVIKTRIDQFDLNRWWTIVFVWISQIASVIDTYAATLTKRTDREVFFLTTQGIVQLVQRYRAGIRGHMKSVVQELLRHYMRVEVQFQQGQYLYSLHNYNFTTIPLAYNIISLITIIAFFV